MRDPITKTIEVPCGQQEAFTVFVEQMGSWWPLSHFSMSAQTGSSAKTLRVESKLGGRIVEVATDETEHHWGTFRAYDPYGSFSMDFHMGLPPCESRVEVTFTVVETERTRVVLTHSNWEAYGDMADMMISGYGKGWGAIFEEAFLAACGGTPSGNVLDSPSCYSDPDGE